MAQTAAHLSRPDDGGHGHHERDAGQAGCPAAARHGEKVTIGGTTVQACEEAETNEAGSEEEEIRTVILHCSSTIEHRMAKKTAAKRNLGKAQPRKQAAGKKPVPKTPARKKPGKKPARTKQPVGTRGGWVWAPGKPQPAGTVYQFRITLLDVHPPSGLPWKS